VTYEIVLLLRCDMIDGKWCNFNGCLYIGRTIGKLLLLARRLC